MLLLARGMWTAMFLKESPSFQQTDDPGKLFLNFVHVPVQSFNLLRALLQRWLVLSDEEDPDRDDEKDRKPRKQSRELL